MIDDFQLLREYLLKSQTIETQVYNNLKSPYRRLLDVLQGDEPSTTDLAVLIRQILLEESERQRGVTQTLQVPTGDQWPTVQEWGRFGIRVLATGDSLFTLQAEEWQPAWLPMADIYPPAKPLAQGTLRRNFRPVHGDPCLKEIGQTHFRCVGQQDALRATLTAPPGATLVVNLPTGSGKSLVAQLPALMTSSLGGVTVVVVPTTALCIDQEQAMAPFIEHPTAYFSGYTQVHQQRNAEIRQRIREGSQRIVFTSPESLLTGLSGAINLAAQAGFLKLLVIDEAHIVDQWGAGFRSAFQELAGLRRHLLTISGEKLFKTLLLSATITESCLDTLETLFSQPGPFQVVSAVQLRPEPSYWFSYCENEEQKVSRVMEALNRLPRPLILYSTKVKDADSWGCLLKEMGYQRLKVMTGNTSSEKRMKIVQEWRDNQLDIVVATSAFGLGVDQGEVKAVIHACVPESLDRYYQEVGRGGRDGCASLSLVIYSQEDNSVATGLSKDIIIGVERGIQRWRSMFNSKESLDNGTYRVNLRTSPGYSVKDIDMDNQYNAQWNSRTINLMSRAGLISLHGELPIWLKQRQPEEQEISQEQIGEQVNYRVVEVLHHGHLDPQIWVDNVEPLRQKEKMLAEKSMRLMNELLQGRECVSHTLREMYTITPTDLRRGVIVAAGCGGCPRCRENHNPPFVQDMPSATWYWASQVSIGQALEKFITSQQTLAIFYDPSQINSPMGQLPMTRLIKWLLSQGIINIVAPMEWQQRLESKLLPDDGLVFFHDNFQPLKMPRLPTLVFHGEGYTVPQNLYRSQSFGVEDKPPLILLLPQNAINPLNGYGQLSEAIPYKNYSLNEICTEVGI